MPDESIQTALAGTSPEPPQGTLQSATAWASVAGGFAAWFAAGSTGFLAGSLGSTLAGLCLLLAAVAVWPSATRRWPLGLTIAGALGCLTWFPANDVQHVLLVAAVLAALALGQKATDRTVLRITASAALTLGFFRLACSSVPAVWLLADTVGGWLGRCAALWTGTPLVIGASFGGLDFLVWSMAFALGALVHTDGPRGQRACWLVAGILGAHLMYLTLLALAADMLDALPIPPTPEFPHPYVPPPWSWARAVRSLVPWNLPLVGATLQLLVQALLLRWWTWPTRSVASRETRNLRAGWAGTKPGWRWAIQSAPYVLAVAVPISATLVLGRQDLAGQRILANLHGQLDWTQPQHGRYGRASAGRYGMLPLLVESLGGHLTKTAEFTAEELAQADIVLLLNPAGPVAAEQRACLEDFVRRGGAMLVVGGPLLRQEGQTGSHNDWLFAQDLQVRQDVALSLTGHWQQSLQPLAHPANAMSWGRCTWFSDSGASLAVGPAAQPLVVGRWGWSDPGSDAVLTNVYRWEAGERLGDLVLAAEQRVGQGTVVVLGDGTALTNEGLVRGYAWTGRLLSYLAHRGASPQVGWRQILSLLLLAALFATLGWRPSAAQVLGVALLVASQAACAAAGRGATQVIPDGRLLTAQPNQPPYRLAYLDASHAEAYSDSDWGFDATNGLTLNLMRNGYLTLALPELTRARLAGTAVVVSIGPAKRFAADERRWLQEFVRDGGLWVCTVGAEEAAASADLLADFGCRVPASPVPTAGDWREPEPLGHFRSLFLDAKDYGQGDYKVAVLFHTGWPVECDATDAEVFVRGPHEEPVVVSRPLGQGRIVVIGDTNFALNKNLEYVGGEPFEGRHENADFWRWLLSRVTDRPEWVPPEPPPLVPSDETAAQEEAQP
ncbi:MAG: hypothetical protein NTY19_42550 [Planctomycetota bacterium]|nr:hypothetical protein [Planctomycetota bacterium]